MLNQMQQLQRQQQFHQVEARQQSSMNPASSWRYKQWTKGINSGLNMQQVNYEQRDIPIQDFNRRQELAGSSETS